MKNFLIIVLALGLTAAAFLTRPDREEFERYVQARHRAPSGNPIDAVLKGLGAKGETSNIEFEDFYLWTVVKRDGRTIYTGVFDRWIDNEKVKESLPS